MVLSMLRPSKEFKEVKQPYGGDCLVHKGRVMRVSSRFQEFPSHRQGIISMDRASTTRVSNCRYEEFKSSGSVERTYQSSALEGCTYQSSAPEGCTYQSGAPEGCTYQSGAPEGCTYQSGAPEGCTHQSSAPEGCTYQSSAPEGCTYP
ncbi:NBS-LRR type resistance protein [Cucumis melo var. makuwa]|uniref:NBS-LRR type resistance protein n=1 Tax=Cucumis melo var. makuwa TaxID=1194695 RepID=A0A5A7V2H2_CUCMM|nr:NBS-LRR type resistance protein [Cucumis melo var. makuwa]